MSSAAPTFHTFFCTAQADSYTYKGIGVCTSGAPPSDTANQYEYSAVENASLTDVLCAEMCTNATGDICRGYSYSAQLIRCLLYGYDDQGDFLV